VSSRPPLVQIGRNHLRHRLVGEILGTERRIPGSVRRALPTNSIATETGFAEAETKALVQSMMRKLRTAM
jgi:hypothetical protein